MTEHLNVLQIFEVDVSEIVDQPTSHVVVNASYSQMNRVSCEKLAEGLVNYHKGYVLSFLLVDAPGRAVVFIPEDHNGGEIFRSVAAAITVIKRSCGWDESESIIVENDSMTDKAQMTLNYENNAWLVEVQSLIIA